MTNSEVGCSAALIFTLMLLACRIGMIAVVIIFCFDVVFVFGDAVACVQALSRVYVCVCVAFMLLTV